MAWECPEFRAAERTFQLLTQNHKLFYEKEIQFRRAMRCPPFSALANLLVCSPKQEETLRLSGSLGRFLDPPREGLKLLGPAEAPVARLRSDFRYQLLFSASSRKTAAGSPVGDEACPCSSVPSLEGLGLALPVAQYAGSFTLGEPLPLGPGCVQPDLGPLGGYARFGVFTHAGLGEHLKRRLGNRGDSR